VATAKPAEATLDISGTSRRRPHTQFWLFLFVQKMKICVRSLHIEHKNAKHQKESFFPRKLCLTN
jgi:hypothetical protein